ncbi:predicted protein [Methanosarcina acetivorans C2A]|uniref:Uncharacterized protein n=1 Tax=Methanosarcina acetivorans (strain ATCC 35395 / DSM 2834 / JCM 12185 / C2A) TaxID=188937 RepID=Q8TPC5_METAC|nr:predicted protein [Methanosarcina acetivorans C2A]
MRTKKFDRSKKTLAILLLLCFVLSVTATLVSADENIKYGKSKAGYKAGYSKGYEEGKIQGQNDCGQYGSTEVLNKIPTPFNKSSWTKDYTESYNKGYKDGYFDGYTKSRYECLK